jgi:agarase
MLRYTVLLALLALCPFTADADPAAQHAFFTAKQIDGRWWLIDPAGKPFISKGVTTVGHAQDTIKGTNISPYGEATQKKYGSLDAWRQAAAKRLIGWGFNTLGAWSDEELAKINVDGKHLAYAPTIDLGGAFVGEQAKNNAWLKGIFPDVFDPAFEKTAHAVAKQKCTPRKDDPRLLCWFTDNELRWGPDWRGKDEILTMFLNLPAKTPGRTAAVDLLRQRYGGFEKFNDVWKTPLKSWDDLAAAEKIAPPFVRNAVYLQNQETERAANEKDPARAAFTADCDAFIGELAERYFRICSEAVRAADPNHMNFGCRFAYLPPRPVVEAAARYLDGISFNCYATDPRDTISKYSAFGKPLIIGEFAFRAQDVGLPNTKGAGPKVKTQADRAAAFEHYVTCALSQPNLVGYHWFEHADEPKEGRFDGENSNYGVVNIKDEVYELLAAKMQEINARAEALHAGNGYKHP